MNFAAALSVVTGSRPNPRATRMVGVLLFFLLFVALCGLGGWQLSRAKEKHDRYQAFLERQNLPRVELSLLQDADSNSRNAVGRPVECRGEFLEKRFLLDNRVRGGRAGYEVIDLFRLINGSRVFVDRGWLPLAESRWELPDIPGVVGEVSLHGFLGEDPVVGIALNADSHQKEQVGVSTERVQRFDLRVAAADLNNADNVFPFLLYLQAGSPGALDVDWPAPGDGSAKHTAYAVQWFAMAGVLVFIGVGIWRRQRPSANQS